MKSNSKLSKKELAYSQIKSSIINNEFTSSTPLTELLLCEKYNLSRTPVREALQQLAGEGFVSFIKDKGFFIAQLGIEDFLQIYEMREALEGMTARLCALRITDAGLQELSDLSAKCIAEYEKGDLQKAMTYDMDFHLCIAQNSRNQKIANTLTNLIELSTCIVVKAEQYIVEKSIEEHGKLLQAIESSDEDLAESVMRKHVVNSKKYHINRYYLGEYH